MANAINHRLRVGFYLINVGYVTFALKYGAEAEGVNDIFEICSTKTETALVVPGIIHFINLFVFSHMRARAEAEKGTALIARLFNPTDRKRSTTLSVPALRKNTCIQLGPFEIKSLKIPRKGKAVEVNLLERP